MSHSFSENNKEILALKGPLRGSFKPKPFEDYKKTIKKRGS